jgi:hypothetical protein
MTCAIAGRPGKARLTVWLLRILTLTSSISTSAVRRVEQIRSLGFCGDIHLKAWLLHLLRKVFQTDSNDDDTSRQCDER